MFTRIVYRRDDEVGRTADGVPRVAFDASGTVVDTMGILPTAPPRLVPPENHDGAKWQNITVGDNRYRVPDPPSALPMWVPLDEGYVVVDVPYALNGDNAALSVTRLHDSGDTLYHHVLHYRPQPYTEDRLMEAAGRQPIVFINGQASATPMNDAAINAVRAKMTFPEFMLPVTGARAFDDGSVWLQLVTEPDEAHRWVVLDNDGAVLGRVELPSRSNPLWTDGQTILASVPDDLDVPWLVRYRLTPGDRAGADSSAAAARPPS